MAKRPINIWLFRGQGRGLSFSLKPRTVAVLVVLIVSLAVFSSAVILQAVRTGAIRVLFAPDSQQTFAEYSNLVLRYGSGLVEDRVERRMDELSGEIARIKGYEERLRKKAEKLEAVLDQAEKLGASNPPFPGLGDGGSSDSNLGLGSGDDDGIFERIFNSADRTSRKKAGRGLASLFSSSLSSGSIDAKDGISLADRLDYYTKVLMTVPMGAPVEGRLSSGFGMRRNPFKPTRWQMHKGLDFAAAMRTPIKVTAKGVVKRAGWWGAYGRVVVVDHGNGVETRYGHLRKISVKVGQEVSRGDEVGLLGSSGRSTGPHLHYEVRVDGKATNPLPWVELASQLARV